MNATKVQVLVIAGILLSNYLDAGVALTGLDGDLGLGSRDVPAAMTSSTEPPSFSTSTSVFLNDTTSKSATDPDVGDDEEEYDYEYDPSLAGVPLPELIPVTLTYAATFLLGITGNALVVVSILRCRQMRTVTNVCLVSLASADFLLVVVCVPIKVRKGCGFNVDWAYFNIKWACLILDGCGKWIMWSDKRLLTPIFNTELDV